MIPLWFLQMNDISPPTDRPFPGSTEYNVHCYLRTDGLGGTVIADLEYPPRVAFVLLSTLIERFAVEVS